jgi:hypothetical protein
MTNETEYPKGYYFGDKGNETTEIPPAEVPVEVPIETKVESPVVNTETVKAPEMSPSEIAKQRREGIANFFTNTKDKFKNKALSVGTSIKNFFGKARALRGSIIESGKALGNEALDFVVAPDAYIKKGAENIAEWVNNKAERLSNFAKGKAELAAAIMSIVEKETAERVNEIQAKIAERYEDLKQFGSDAIEAGAGKIRDIKEGFRNKKNNMIIAFLKSIEGVFRTKADRVAGKIQLLQGLKTN